MTTTDRTAAICDALVQIREIERHLAHARLALADIEDEAHPRHLSVIDARDTAYTRVTIAATLSAALVDLVGNVPGCDPDAGLVEIA